MDTFEFNKSASTIEQQIELLRVRGMFIGDEDQAKNCLETIGYYRLSAYWLIFENSADPNQTRSKTFKAGTDFDEVVNLYIFDRRLRNLLMEASERLEIAIRARWTNLFAIKFGAHGYLNSLHFKDGARHVEQLHRLSKSFARSSETFVLHYKQKYHAPYFPPMWAATELMTLGELSIWFKLTKDSGIKQKVANALGLPTIETAEAVFEVLSLIRNICAHHSRLWNRRLVKRLPKIKRFRNAMNVIDGENDNRLFNVLVVVLKLLEKHHTDATLSERIFDLLNQVDQNRLDDMGFPKGWKLKEPWISI